MIENITPILSVKSLDASISFYTVAKSVRMRQPPTNFSWAYEMKVEDPDGHVLRFGSEPKA